MGDRSGGREPKGASLKKSKKNPGAPAAKIKKAAIAKEDVKVTRSLRPPIPSTEKYFDCSIALLSRQFDRDRDKVILRAQLEGHCCGLLAWFADVEKQSLLADLCKSNSGICYFATGVHPDNIDKTNKKKHDEWLLKTEELSTRVECIAILSGLNLSKEVGSYFAQESILISLMTLASKLTLPLIVHAHDGASLSKIVEIYNSLEMDEGIDKCAVIVHDVVAALKGPSASLTEAISSGFIFSLSAAGIADLSSVVEKEAATELVRSLPIERILCSTTSPWNTPQNLPDPYLRTMRNESANIASVVDAVSSIIGISHDSLAQIVRANTMRVFGLESLHDVSQVTEDKNMETNPVNTLTADTEVNNGRSEEGSSSLEKQSLPLKLDKEKEAVSEEHFRCVRCRKQLFSLSDLTSHGLSSAAKTVFKIGEGGLCASSLFIVLPQDGSELSSRTGLVFHGNAVECAECSMKVGKFTPSGAEDALCSCGAHVPGPVVKVQANKVDRVHPSGVTLDAKALAERSLQETEKDLELQASLPHEETGEADGGKSSKKTKKLKSANKGNFSSYRNKSFIPNASRTASKSSSVNVNNISAAFSSLDLDEDSNQEDSN